MDVLHLGSLASLRLKGRWFYSTTPGWSGVAHNELFIQSFQHDVVVLGFNCHPDGEFVQAGLISRVDLSDPLGNPSALAFAMVLANLSLDVFLVRAIRIGRVVPVGNEFAVSTTVETVPV